MRNITDMLGHLAGPRRTVSETPYGRVLTAGFQQGQPEARTARVVDPREMFNEPIQSR